jgi:dGTPase
VKKGYASFNDLVYWLESGIATEDDSKEKELVKEILVYIKKKNKEFREEKLSPGELNDISMQMFRVISISKLIDCVADSFVNVVRDEELYQSLEKSLASGKGLIEFSEGKLFCDLVKAFDFTYGYTNREVLKLELRGDRIIRDVLDMIWLGVSAVSYNKEKNKINLPEDRFARFAYNSISENYRRRFTTALEQGKQDEIYNKCHLVCDFISGMTEKFLMSYHDELKALQTS